MSRWTWVNKFSDFSLKILSGNPKLHSTRREEHFEKTNFEKSFFED